MKGRYVVVVAGGLLAAAVAAAWLLPSRLPAAPDWNVLALGEARLWARPAEAIAEGGALRLLGRRAVIWIETEHELPSALFLLRETSGEVAVRSRWLPSWLGATKSSAARAAERDGESRLFLEWQKPRIARRDDAGRLYYRMFLTLSPDSPPGEARLAYLGTRELVDRDLYAAGWEGCGAPDAVSAEEEFLALAHLRNLSGHPWPHQGNARVRLGYRWRDAAGAELTRGAERRDLEAAVAPEDELARWLRVRAPDEPGRYVLELDAVYEPVAWFSDKGAETCRVEVEVEPD